MTITCKFHDIKSSDAPNGEKFWQVIAEHNGKYSEIFSKGTDSEWSEHSRKRLVETIESIPALPS